ncbi:MAG: A/G-specific adenine glycosylase [Myxococcales bacterium]
MREPAEIRAALLSFFDEHARELPWRDTRDPYAVWVSEIMLQQTRVDTVVRYYDRFLQRFPTAEALAAAEQDEVMAAWSGLGYYRRARMLHAGVREVVARYGGRVPQDLQARRGLPGVGRYTAGAIGSIAFGLPEPVVDGNVTRVLCRLHGIDEAPERAAAQKRLWALAEALAEGPRPGDLNQALMELGATVCTPSSPACERCPLSEHCVARAEGRVEQLPRPKKRKAPREVRMVALLATRGRGAGRSLWLGRGGGALFGGLWNLPMAEGRGREAAATLARDSGLRGTLSKQAIGELTHVLTHRRLQVELWRMGGARARDGSELRAAPLDSLGELGVSKLTLKAAARLMP